MKSLKGCSLAGSSLTRNRVKNDYYATPYETTEALLKVEKFEGACIEVFDGDFRKVIPHSKYMNIDTYEEFKEYIRKMFE